MGSHGIWNAVCFGKVGTLFRLDLNFNTFVERVFVAIEGAECSEGDIREDPPVDLVCLVISGDNAWKISIFDPKDLVAREIRFEALRRSLSSHRIPDFGDEKSSVGEEIHTGRFAGSLAISSSISHRFFVDHSLPKLYRLLFALVAMAGSTGCSILPEKKQNADQAGEAIRNQPTKIPVGNVHLVNFEKGFVLIRSSRFLDIEPERELLVTGDDGTEIAKLRVSPARKGSFLTADILYGTPQVGNHVLMVHRSAASRNQPTSRDEAIQVLE